MKYLQAETRKNSSESIKWTGMYSSFFFSAPLALFQFSRVFFFFAFLPCKKRQLYNLTEVQWWWNQKYETWFSFHSVNRLKEDRRERFLSQSAPLAIPNRWQDVLARVRWKLKNWTVKWLESCMCCTMLCTTHTHVQTFETTSMLCSFNRWKETEKKRGESVCKGQQRFNVQILLCTH